MPSFYQCSECHTRFDFPFAAADYYVGTQPPGRVVGPADLLPVLTEPVWCHTCDGLSLAEHIEPLRTFELAWGSARCGRTVDYPVNTQACDRDASLARLEPYLRWRMARRRPARTLCCGHAHFQRLNDRSSVMRHAGCEHGIVEPMLTVRSANWKQTPHQPRGSRLYDSEGRLLGQLTVWVEAEHGWLLQPALSPSLDAELNLG